MAQKRFGELRRTSLLFTPFSRSTVLFSSENLRDVGGDIVGVRAQTERRCGMAMEGDTLRLATISTAPNIDADHCF